MELSTPGIQSKFAKQSLLVIDTITGNDYAYNSINSIPPSTLSKEYNKELSGSPLRRKRKKKKPAISSPAANNNEISQNSLDSVDFHSNNYPPSIYGLLKEGIDQGAWTENHAKSYINRVILDRELWEGDPPWPHRFVSDLKDYNQFDVDLGMLDSFVDDYYCIWNRHCDPGFTITTADNALDATAALSSINMDNNKLNVSDKVNNNSSNNNNNAITTVSNNNCNSEITGLGLPSLPVKELVSQLNSSILAKTNKNKKKKKKKIKQSSECTANDGTNNNNNDNNSNINYSNSGFLPSDEMVQLHSPNIMGINSAPYSEQVRFKSLEEQFDSLISDYRINIRVVVVDIIGIDISACPDILEYYNNTVRPALDDNNLEADEILDSVYSTRGPMKFIAFIFDRLAMLDDLSTMTDILDNNIFNRGVDNSGSVDGSTLSNNKLLFNNNSSISNNNDIVDVSALSNQELLFYNDSSTKVQLIVDQPSTGMDQQLINQFLLPRVVSLIFQFYMLAFSNAITTVVLAQQQHTLLVLVSADLFKPP
jgi:hypothetical protein